MDDSAENRAPRCSEHPSGTVPAMGMKPLRAKEIDSFLIKNQMHQTGKIKGKLSPRKSDLNLDLHPFPPNHPLREFPSLLLPW